MASKTASQDPYHLLGVPPYADDDEVEAAYLAGLTELPSDATSERHALTDAYALIADSDSRARYNLARWQAHKAETATTGDNSLRVVLAGEGQAVGQWLRGRLNRRRRIKSLLALFGLAGVALTPLGKMVLPFAFFFGLALAGAKRARDLHGLDTRGQLAVAGAGGGVGLAGWFVVSNGATFLVTGLVSAAILVVGLPILLASLFLRWLLT